MSGPTPIDPSAATQTPTPDFAMSWICPACGQARAYEGGRPGEHDECETCGCRVAVAAPPTRQPAAAATNRYLF